MKIIKFSFLNIFAVMHQIEGSYSLNDEQPLPVCALSGHFFAQVFVFFNWAPSYLSFALRFFNLFGKTLSHTCFRFESVHTHFSFRRGSLSTHTLGLSGLHSVFFLPVSLDVRLWTPAQHLCGFRFEGQHDRMSQEPFQLQRSCLWCPERPLTYLFLAIYLFIGYLLLALSNRNKIHLPCWNL